MGNKILAAYDVSKESCCHSVELKWKLHSATVKERPDEKLTIFLFEKKNIDKYPKNTKEAILDVLRKDASSLQRLRHPRLLSVVEALNEERSTLVFATKMADQTVAQLLEQDRHALSPLEMKCGLLDLSEGLGFLHNDAKTAHLALSPHSIFFAPPGKWLIGGLGNSMSGMTWGQMVDCPFTFGLDSGGQMSPEPPARYSAPEMAQLPGKCGLESDVFSLGLLCYELMSTDRQTLTRSQCKPGQIPQMRTSILPPDLVSILQRMLSSAPNQRPTVKDFSESEFFHDVNVRAVRFLEQLGEKDEMQRFTFVQGLPKLLQEETAPLCAPRVVRERIIPVLCTSLQYENLMTHIVPCMYMLLKRDRIMDSAQFQSRVWPYLRGVFAAKSVPIDVVTLMIRNTDILIKFLGPADVQATVIPFVLRCLDIQEPAILSEVLDQVPTLHKQFDYKQVKDQVLPRMLQLLLSSSSVKVKVQVLMGLSRIFEVFDKTTITDVILVAFEKLAKSDRTPAVCMCLLGCFDAMSKHLGPKITADKILPLIFPMLVEDALSMQQYQTQLSVTKKLLQRVEAARSKDLSLRKENEAEVVKATSTAPSATAAPAQPLSFDELLAAPKKTETRTLPAASTPTNVPPPPAPAAGASNHSVDLLGGPAPAAPAAQPQSFDMLLMGGGGQSASSAKAAAPPSSTAGSDLLMDAPTAVKQSTNFDPFNLAPPPQPKQQTQPTGGLDLFATPTPAPAATSGLEGIFSNPGPGVGSGLAPGPSMPGGLGPGPQMPGSLAPGPQMPGGLGPGPQMPGSMAPGPQMSGGLDPFAGLSAGSQMPGAFNSGSQMPGGFAPGPQIGGGGYNSGMMPGQQMGQMPGQQMPGMSPMGQMPGSGYPGGIQPKATGFGGKEDPFAGL